MDYKEKKYFVALSQESKFGARTLAKLLQRFPRLEDLWKASAKDMRHRTIPEEIIKKIVALRKKVDPDREMDKLLRLAINVIMINDDNYPRLLREIYDPPALLYVKGEIKTEDEMSIAVVGARKFTSYGARAGEDIASGLAEAGITIVSGLALGIDSCAHKAAISVSGGRTIGVLACGLDQVYPFSNRTLAEKIIAGRGAIISEYPVGMPAMKYNFPVRNRIIAGLSLGVLVVEASLNSGTFLTATAALDYNREVFAIPGSIYSEKSIGPNSLIKMGAKLVKSSEDVISELNIKSKSKKIEARKILPDTKDEEVLLKLLTAEDPTHIDQLVLKSGLNIGKINSTLIMMEMKGKIRNLGASQYVIN